MADVLVTKLGVVLFSTERTLEDAGWELSGPKLRTRLTSEGWDAVGVDGGPIAFVAPHEQEAIVEGQRYTVHYEGKKETVEAAGEREWYEALYEAQKAAGATDGPTPGPEPVDGTPDPTGNGDGRRRPDAIERLFSIPLPTRSFDGVSAESPLRTRVRRMIQNEAGPIGEFASAAEWHATLARHTEEYERAGVRLLRWTTRRGYDQAPGQQPLGVYAGDYSLLEHASSVAAEIAETLPPFSDTVDQPSVDAARHVLLSRIHRVPGELAREQISTLKLEGEANALRDALAEFSVVLGYRNADGSLAEEDVVGTSDEQALTQFRVLDFWVSTAYDVMTNLVEEPVEVGYGSARVRLLAQLDGASNAAHRLSDVWARALDFTGADQEREEIEVEGRTITIQRYVEWVESDAVAIKSDVEAGGRPAIRASIGLLEIQAAAAEALLDQATDDDAPTTLAHPIVLAVLETLHAHLDRALEAAHDAVDPPSSPDEPPDQPEPDHDRRSNVGAATAD